MASGQSRALNWLYSLVWPVDRWNFILLPYSRGAEIGKVRWEGQGGSHKERPGFRRASIAVSYKWWTGLRVLWTLHQRFPGRPFHLVSSSILYLSKSIRWSRFLVSQAIWLVLKVDHNMRRVVKPQAGKLCEAAVGWYRYQKRTSVRILSAK